ncbi:MAG TPA: helix-turn-helix domain-containing protein [Acidimicrobiales bacterium]
MSSSSSVPPVSLSEYRALARFRRALRAFLHFSEEAARGVGMTPAQHQLLLVIKGSESGQSPTIREIADSLKLRHHSAVELVDRAVAAGLVARAADPDDARRRRLILTGVGEEKLAHLSTLHREELRRFPEEIFEHLASLG